VSKIDRENALNTFLNTFLINKRHERRQVLSLVILADSPFNFCQGCMVVTICSILSGRHYFFWLSLFVNQKYNGKTAKIVMTTFAFRYVSYFLYEYIILSNPFYSKKSLRRTLWTHIFHVNVHMYARKGQNKISSILNSLTVMYSIPVETY